MRLCLNLYMCSLSSRLCTWSGWCTLWYVIGSCDLIGHDNAHDRLRPSSGDNDSLLLDLYDGQLLHPHEHLRGHNRRLCFRPLQGERTIITFSPNCCIVLTGCWFYLCTWYLNDMERDNQAILVIDICVVCSTYSPEDGLRRLGKACLTNK